MGRRRGKGVVAAGDSADHCGCWLIVESPETWEVHTKRANQHAGMWVRRNLNV